MKLQFSKTYKFGHDINTFKMLYDRLVLPNEPEALFRVFYNPNKPYGGEMQADNKKFTFYSRRNTGFEPICEIEYLDETEKQIQVSFRYNRAIILMLFFQTAIFGLIMGFSNVAKFSPLILLMPIFFLLVGLFLFFVDKRYKIKYIEQVLKILVENKSK